MAVLERNNGHDITGILPWEIEAKRDAVNIGDEVSVYIWKEQKNGIYRVSRVNGTVLSKHKNVVITTSGTFQWKQLLLEKPKRRHRRTSA